MDMSSSEDEETTVTIDDLPDEVLEYILSYVSPYNDSESCKLVCKRWWRIINSVQQYTKSGLYKSVVSARILWRSISPTNFESSVITKRYSHAACYCDNFMYVFGGCTSRCTTFNDLWTLDLSIRKWIRPFTTGTYPSPKACATLCCYDKNLILFGGWTHPPSYPPHQTLKLFNELHVYNILTHKWYPVHSTVSPPPMASHSATVHGHLMVVFGGLQRADTLFLYKSSNSVWCYDFLEEAWSQPETSDPKPKIRYGQSQIYLDEKNILIIGGCEGPNSILDDVWLLTITDDVWIWKQIIVHNPQWAAPHLWCHPACRVDNAVVVFSRGMFQTVSPYSLGIAGSSDSPIEDDIPAEVQARVAGQESSSYDRDTNVNGQRGTLSRPSKSSDDPNSSDDDSTFVNSPIKAYNPHRRRETIAEPHCSKHGALDIELQMAAFREDAERYVNNTAFRKKQLLQLKRMEEKYKNPNKGGKSSSDEEPADTGPESTYVCYNTKNRMNMYVMDIADVLTNGCVTWMPPRCSQNAPREKMLHSLVLGKGELILFGGVQKNPAFTFPVYSYKSVSNTTHIITAPRNIV